MCTMTDRAGKPRGFAGTTIYLFEQYMPDPFVVAIGLTILVVVTALFFAPHPSPSVILSSWYDGVFAIFGFAFQIIMILVAGHALAQAPPVQRVLEKVVTLAKTPNQAVVLTFLVSAASTWLNWGFGMVIGALLAREVASRLRVDFAWLVAAAFSGWMVWSVGLSGTIPLAQITHGSSLNIVEKVTGHLLPFGDTVFAIYTLVPTVLFIVIMPFVLVLLRPPPEEMEVYTPPSESPAAEPPEKKLSFARQAERSPIGSVLMVLMGFAYFLTMLLKGTLSLDINTIIFIFILLGLALHRSPIEYGTAIRQAAKLTGSFMLQYPIYGGIMGIMTGTGLAQAISIAVSNAATASTLPLFSFLASLLITLIIPSGGGHWAVQGSFTVPAAVHLHASLGATTMAVAFGEQVADMIHPMWALPIVAVAGIGVQRVLGFTAFTFLVGVVLYGTALVFLG